jgi:hypothetical protein
MMKKTFVEDGKDLYKDNRDPCPIIHHAGEVYPCISQFEIEETLRARGNLHVWTTFPLNSSSFLVKGRKRSLPD